LPEASIASTGIACRMIMPSPFGTCTGAVTEILGRPGEALVKLLLLPLSPWTSASGRAADSRGSSASAAVTQAKAKPKT
jgi:hypothetical protein